MCAIYNHLLHTRWFPPNYSQLEKRQTLTTVRNYDVIDDVYDAVASHDVSLRHARLLSVDAAAVSANKQVIIEQVWSTYVTLNRLTTYDVGHHVCFQNACE